jgi:hypothetical protein
MMKQIILVVMACLGASALGHAEQVCNEHTTKFNLFKVFASDRYEVVVGSNGTEVLDLTTNLVWQRCSAGQTWNGKICAGTPIAHTWVSALKSVTAARAVHADYRLPNIRELTALREADCIKPAMNIEFFDHQPLLTKDAAFTDSIPYWSSSPFAGNHTDAWFFNTWNGATGVKPKTQTAYLRFVRAKQSEPISTDD